ncbi:MAG: LamG domain-containing protein, partial [Anaerohalosphaera sp.]|nr:LamG domain-containing protein [Anaerohalosphaera sp.]
MKMKLLFLIALLGLSCQVFAGDPNVPGIIQYYAFDGDLNDSEGTNHGTAMNEGPEFVDGVIGQAAKFFGDRYMDIGPNAFPNAAVGLNTGSICFWFNSVSTTTDTIIGSASQSSSLMLNVLFVSQRLRCAIRDDNGTMRQVDVDDTSLRDGQWHHVALVYATGPDTVVTVYVDGEPQDLIVRASGNPE